MNRINVMVIGYCLCCGNFCEVIFWVNKKDFFGKIIYFKCGKVFVIFFCSICS